MVRDGSLTRKLTRGVLALPFLGIAPSAAAAILYEQTPEPGGDSWTSHEAADLFPGGYYADTFGFEPGLDRVIEEVVWWGEYETLPLDPGEPSDLFNIRFFTDNGGTAGDLLEDGVFMDVVAEREAYNGAGPDQFSAALDTPLRLAAGTRFYLSIVGQQNLLADGVAFNWWDGNSPERPGVGGPVLWTSDLEGGFGSGAEPEPEHLAFQLDGHVVPEPATVTLMGIGVGALALRRWRQRN